MASVASAASSSTSLVDIQQTNSYDAFQRLRTSQPFTLFDSNQIWGKMPLTYDEKVVGHGGATSVANTSDSYVSMTVSQIGDRVVRQSHEYLDYQSGKSRLVLMSGVLDVHGAIQGSGITARIGSFDDAADKTVDSGGNGHFFQLQNGVCSVVERSSTVGAGGTTIDTVIPQTQWNVDTMLGTGPSKISITNWRNNFVFVIDLEWLGVGTVRMGVVLEDTIFYVHYFEHNALQKPYMKMAKLPVRYEISKSAPATLANSVGEMRQICTTVISEGGYTPYGRTFSFANGSVARSINTTEVPILSMRLKTTNNRQTFKIKAISFLTQTTNDQLWYRVVLNPASLTGAAFVSAETNSAVEIDTSATAFGAPQTTMASGYVSTQSTSTFINNVEDTATQPGGNADMAGVPDIISIVGKNLGSGPITFYVTVTWVELI